MPRTNAWIDTIRGRLVRDLVVMIVLLAGTIVTISIVATRSAVHELSRLAVESGVEQVRTDLSEFVTPVREALLVLEAFVREGRLDPDDPEAFRRLMGPLLGTMPQTASAILADEDGREQMLLRVAGGWRQRETWAATRPGVARWIEWQDGRARHVREEDLGYDARTRPWYQGAMERAAAAWSEADADSGDGRGGAAARVYWTDAYRFHTTQQLGVTAAIAGRDRDGRVFVVGLDVLLEALSDFASAPRTIDGTLVFVTDESLRLLALPRGQHFPDEPRRQALLLSQPRASQESLIVDASRALDPTGGQDATPLRFGGAEEAVSALVDPAVRFRSEGRTWWGAVRAVATGGDRWFVLAVLVPQDAVLSQLAWMRVAIVLVLSVVLGFAIVRAFGLAYRVSRPIEVLVQQTDRISHGDLESTLDVESGVVEVRRLVAAHDRMRRGLRTLMKLERDLQIAHQIQQSTFPDAVPEVPGYRLAARSLPAEATGGDTYDLVRRDDGRLVLMLADATGHGVGPSLSAVQVHSMLRMGVTVELDAPAMMQALNEHLEAELPPAHFVTAWIGELDPERHRLHSISAGQGPLLHVVAASGEVRVLRADAPPLGVTNAIDVTGVQVELAPGDLFVVLSDGYFEAMDPQSGLLGREAIEALLRDRRHEPATRVLEAVDALVARHMAGSAATDDRTAVILQRRGGGRKVRRDRA